MLNTRIAYMYRDGSNYKTNAEAIFEGEITAEEKKALLKNLDDTLYFIPSDVGLRDLQADFNAKLYDDDHPWHELEDGGIILCTTKPTEEIDIHAFVKKFVHTKWNPEEAGLRNNLPAYEYIRQLRIIKATPFKKLPLLINTGWVNKMVEDTYNDRIKKGK